MTTPDGIGSLSNSDLMDMDGLWGQCIFGVQWSWMMGRSIEVEFEDGFNFACINFSSQQQKRRKVSCIRQSFFEVPNHLAEFSN